MLISRRGLITGLASLVPAPAIVRASSIMPVKASPRDLWLEIAEQFRPGDYVAIDPLLIGRVQRWEGFRWFEVDGTLCSESAAQS